MKKSTILTYTAANITKRIVLEMLTRDGFDRFDEAIDAVYISLSKEIDQLAANFRKDSDVLSKFVEDNKDIDFGDLTSFPDIDTSVYFDGLDKADQLTSMAEMKIVYLFKNVERIIRSLIREAYPQTAQKNLNRWKAFSEFFKKLDIKLDDLPGYQECADLNRVNNHIKHSPENADELKNIREFKGGNLLGAPEFVEFHKRVKPKAMLFVRNLAIAIAHNTSFPRRTG